MNPWVLKKSPQAKCFCSAQCFQCPGLRKCKVYVGADARHRAFAVKLIGGMLGYYGDPIENFLPKHEEADANRFARAARRWLKVTEGGVKRG